MKKPVHPVGKMLMTHLTYNRTHTHTPALTHLYKRTLAKLQMKVGDFAVYTSCLPIFSEINFVESFSCVIWRLGGKEKSEIKCFWHIAANYANLWVSSNPGREKTRKKTIGLGLRKKEKENFISHSWWMIGWQVTARKASIALNSFGFWNVSNEPRKIGRQQKSRKC